MTQTIERSLLKAYSEGIVSRRDLSERAGFPVGFGMLLAALHANNLSLPRFPSDPNSPGVRLLRQLAEQAGRRG